ncbi:Riboflavin kinase [Clonorchis sinensis]|uniref:riboflavin kinase n=1 Tax=Clonorchis sinensis TaxID=79923 RepID=A0A8T1N218_CLOSI|nr:Riboflavin kinase [Clonorchis sinensis]
MFLGYFCDILRAYSHFMLIELRNSAMFYAAGKVVHGFGRGSKQLGVPTANLDASVVARLPNTIANGIYFGWARVEGYPVCKTVVSIGWNPFFRNTTRSVEAHLIERFDEDFYDRMMHLLILKYHRPERDFENLDALVDCIRDDIRQANQYLDEPEATIWNHTNWFDLYTVSKSPI